MFTACRQGQLKKLKKLIKSGESVNSANYFNATPVMLALAFNQLRIAQVLAHHGADMSTHNIHGLNCLHYAAFSGSRQIIEWVLANTTIAVNSINSGHQLSPVMLALRFNRLSAAKVLVERGANLFMKSIANNRAIDMYAHDDQDNVLGPQVLSHAKDLSWSSVKQLLLLSKSYDASDIVLSSSSTYLAASVLTNSGLVRLVASFLINNELIVKDPNVTVGPDDVKKRVEASLAAAAVAARNNNV
jgi:ankyrin repeat protein